MHNSVLRRDVHHRLWFDRVQRTLTFTVTQPPRILEPFTGQCAGCCRNDNWNLSGTMYQMAGDFTARHKMGMELSGLCPQCAPDGFLPDREQDWSAWQQGPEIGSDLAGADGSLGRCFTYRIKLHPCAVQGGDMLQGCSPLLMRFACWHEVCSIAEVLTTMSSSGQPFPPSWFVSLLPCSS